MSGRIYDRLVQEFSKKVVFKDVDSIPLGIDFQDHLTNIVSNCEVVLVVIGKQWLTVKDEHGNRRIDNAGDFVAIEIAAALERNIHIIPLLVQNASMPSESQLPACLKNWPIDRVRPSNLTPTFMLMLIA